MKVVLLKDVANLGSRGQVIEVKEGYAKNFLFRKKLAKVATDSELKKQQHFRKKEEEKEEQKREDARNLREQLKNVQISFQVKAGENDKVFGSITSANIADRLQENGYTIDKRDIDLSQPLSTLGEHLVGVKLFRDIHAELRVVLEKE